MHLLPFIVFYCRIQFDDIQRFEGISVYHSLTSMGNGDSNLGQQCGNEQGYSTANSNFPIKFELATLWQILRKGSNLKTLKSF